MGIDITKEARINLKLTNEEKEIIEIAATKLNVSVSKYMRESAIAAASRQCKECEGKGYV
jgi:uncharacterized protein (DUF1778 family)